MWTLVGGGLKRKEQSRRLMKDFMPKGCDWIKEQAVQFDPDNSSVTTSGGKAVQYDYLVVAMGLQLNFDQASPTGNTQFHDWSSCEMT